jgi:2-polyprenyl-6-methoxyphenol hydroxylase-like FAD-dependent oxidoreductase
MSGTRKRRVVVVGAGIAGSLIATGLMDHPKIDLVCLERAGQNDHAEAGTGLNIGPNALKCLRAHLPERADTLISSSLPWRRWTIALTNGRSLMDLSLSDVADNDGIRIRWAELYALLRAPLANRIVYDAELTEASRGRGGLRVAWRDKRSGQPHLLEGIDLLIGSDGRYSLVRESFFGSDTPHFMGVCLYRLLFPAGAECPIGDYGQWFNGPNRLLAFRVPGDFVYCAGSLPIPSDADIPAAIKEVGALRAAYTPKGAPPSAEVAYLIDAIEQHHPLIHWARLQEGSVRFRSKESGVLLVGDSAHPMVPTLGQGATQAIEDACVVIEEVRETLARGAPMADLPARIEGRRKERVEFVMDFSREATDTMLAGADPVAGTAKKSGSEFRRKLAALYRDVPLPA